MVTAKKGSDVLMYLNVGAYGRMHTAPHPHPNINISIRYRPHEDKSKFLCAILA